jgi:WD40 repeat protein
VSVDGTPSIQILDTQTYQVIDTVSSEQATWHPSENLLALSADTSLTFWTPSTGILDSETEIGRITALDWSDNGRFIATAGSNGTIRLWGVPTSE